MMSVEAARAAIKAGLRPTGAEIVSLADAAGRVTARAVTARRDQPVADMSAMDGYAIRAVDGSAGARLAVIGAAPAGHPFAGGVGPGEALRLFTGSPMPDGTDTVVIQENTRREGDIVLLTEAAGAGRHVRRRAGDFGVGELLIEPGRRLGARLCALAAAANVPWLAVRRRPVVALLATGDEVVLPGEPIGPGGLTSSNSFGLAAFVAAAGGIPLTLPVARDDVEAIAEAARGAERADMLVTLGGASVGDHDLVRPALARLGFDADVLKIAMRPGKPLMHGRLLLDGREVPVLGLPGNPVSALVCAALFLGPAIETLLGLPGEAPQSHRLRLAGGLPANDGRADFLRAMVDGDRVSALAIQDSSRLRDLTRADALILRAPGATAAGEGEVVEVLRLDELGL